MTKGRRAKIQAMERESRLSLTRRVVEGIGEGISRWKSPL